LVNKRFYSKKAISKFKQMTNNPRNAGRKPVPDGVLVKTTVPKTKVKKLKDYSKELIKEYNDETRPTTTIS
jgi:hypothetical protein